MHIGLSCAGQAQRRCRISMVDGAAVSVLPEIRGNGLS